MKKVAVFGGAFDPVHDEHLNIARYAKAELGLDDVIFLPTADAPHKAIDAAFDLRFEMLRLACGDEFIVSDFEAGNLSKNYTYLNLRELKKKYGDFYLLMGGDSMADFLTWKKPAYIAEHVKIAVCLRGDRDEKAHEVAEYLRNNHDADITFLSYRPKNISSSEVKTDLRLFGRSAILTDEKVKAFIAEHGLYDEYMDFKDRLIDAVPHETYVHSLRTVQFACRFFRRLGLKYNDVFLAALLHDCKKGDNGEYYDMDDKARHTPVAHQFAGAISAERDFGITDKSVLDAIRFHCTAKPGMNSLEKLIYTADALEDGRDYPDVKLFRKIAYADFESGFLTALWASMKKLKSRGGTDIYPLTKQAYEYYIGETE